MEKGQVGTIFILFLGIIVALALLPAIANEQSTLTTKTSVSDETWSLTDFYSNGSQINVTYPSNITLSNAARTDNCAIDGVTVTNASGTALTVTTDYVVYDTTGIIQFLNTEETNITNFASGGVNNNTLIDYTYCQDGYIVNSGSGRSLAALLTLFAALVILSFAVFYLYRSMKY